MQVIFLSGDLMFFSRLSGAARQADCELAPALSADVCVARAAENPRSLIVLDLAAKGVDVADLVRRLRELPEPPRAIVAYAPHVHEERLAAAAAAGCDLTLTRGQFNAQMQAILARYAAAS